MYFYMSALCVMYYIDHFNISLQTVIFKKYDKGNFTLYYISKNLLYLLV